MQVIKLEKPRARRRVEIETSETDDWFLFVKRIEKSTGEVKSSSMIIRKDLDNWLKYFLGNGWKYTEEIVRESPMN